jgi:hypothetical protein
MTSNFKTWLSHFFLEVRGAAEGTLDDAAVNAPDLVKCPGLNGRGRQGEVEFRINGAAADDHAAAGGHGMGGEAEGEFHRIGDGEGFVAHGSG